jgi:hypothetical protein
VILVPKIIKNTKKERLFWRGIFDTDGSIRPKNNAISMTTASAYLYNDLLDFCRRNGITTFNKKETDRYRVTIANESIVKFAEIVGSSHPRKQMNLLRYLKDGCSYNVPVNKKTNRKLEKVIEYLRPYKGNVYVRITKRREIIDKKVLLERLKFIKNQLNCSIIEVNRPRKNNHYYICSKKLLEEINKCYEFKPSWSALDVCELDQLKERWSRYE